MSNGLFDKSDVVDQMNFIEKTVVGASAADNYQQAMLKNQQMMLQALAENNVIGNTQRPQVPGPNNDGISIIDAEADPENLPTGVVGTSTEEIPVNEKGAALFDIRGTKYETTVTASSSIEANEVITVIDEGNVARPASGNQDALSLLTGAGAAGQDGLISPDGYNIYETTDLPVDEVNSDGTTTVEPGEETTLVTTGSLDIGGYLLAVGATSSEPVQYYVEVDGDYRPGGMTNSPLGTTNSPLSFPETFGGVIPAVDEIAYKAYIPPELDTIADVAATIHVEEL